MHHGLHTEGSTARHPERGSISSQTSWSMLMVDAFPHILEHTDSGCFPPQTSQGMLMVDAFPHRYLRAC